jgi:PAS domain S-box-containing protein
LFLTVGSNRLQTRQPPSQCFILAFDFFGSDRSYVRASDRVDGPGVKITRILRGVFLLIVFTLSLLSAQSRANDAPKRVLILHSFNYTFPATTVIAEAVRKRLLERSPQRIEIDADFLDLARNTDPAHDARTATFLREKYTRNPPDLVMTLGSAAFPFIVKHRDEIAPNIPVVATSISPQRYAAVQPPAGVTGILSEYDLEKTLALAEQLQPEARRLFVIAGSGEVDRRWQQTARTIIEKREHKFETTYLFELPYAKLVEELSHVPHDAIVILLTMFADGDGKAFVPAEVATALPAVSAAPIYGPYDTYLGNGVVGGFVESFESVGIAAADLALDIMAGKNPATLGPRANSGQIWRVDYRAMQRWNLRESNLPPGSVVLFKQPGLWDQHRNFILGTMLIVALQSCVVAALLVQRRRRQQAELSLKESEERMTFTAASANVGLWQLDRTTNELWATEHCRAMFGLASDVPLTRDTFVEAIHPDDRGMAVAAIRQVRKARESAVTQVRVVLADNQIRWISVRAHSRPDHHGASNQFSGVFVDITEQKTAESEADLQRQEVTHLMRVSVLGELSGAIAHEVNQPLTAILSNAQAALYMLAQDKPDLAEVRDALQDIVQEDNRAGEVVHRLRSLLKKGVTRTEPVDINELVDQTTTLLRSEMIGRRIVVETDLAADLPAHSGDSVQLQQVLLNLVMNAMDAMASTAVAKRRVTISTRATPAGAIEVLIKDRGPGIKPLQGGKLFEPFYTTKEHGLGLGLAICSSIVQAHGGAISLSDNDGDGAVAGFRLPAQEMMVAAQ